MIFDAGSVQQRMRWERYVARMGQMRNAYKNLLERAHSGDLGIDVVIIFEWILGK